MWRFAAAVLFVLLAIGLILNHTGSSDIRTASIDAFPPHVQIEGFER